MKQPLDVNIELVEMRAAIHAVVQTEQISAYDAALRLADWLDVPELAATLLSGQVDHENAPCESK